MLAGVTNVQKSRIKKCFVWPRKMEPNLSGSQGQVARVKDIYCSTPNPGFTMCGSQDYNNPVDHFILFRSIILKLFRTTAFVILAVACFNAAAISEHIEILYRWQWPEYASGGNVVALPQIHKTLSLYEEDRETRIEIRYPGGDAGRLWAESVAGWLISYGVPGKYLELFPGSGGGDRLAIVFIDRRRQG